ncbi:response regulator [Winogradskyella sp.]|nr:response regulator [Winogradskyella sp.]MDC0007025.1 response regulator [Winogradskyella sp.]MDC1505891.1 response regulator [Winogradskyella sp.]
MKEKINILIIDDHPMIVSGLKSGLSNLLNKEITIDSVNSCKNAIEKLKNKNSKFDLVILDINLPVLSHLLKLSIKF